MKYVKIILLINLFLFVNTANAQVLKSRIAKIGYSGGFMPYQVSDHYSFHFDLENSTRRNFITNEFGAGYLHDKSNLFYSKFDVKFYPVSALLNNLKYQTFYASIGPGIYYENVDEGANRFGVGIFTTGGIQFLLNNRISVAFEVEMNFISNLNQTESYTKSYSFGNSYFTNSIKIGYVFNRTH